MSPSTEIVVNEGIAQVVLDAPPLNILSRAVLAEVRKALAAALDDPGSRVVLLRAAGKHFSAGADVGEHLPPHYRNLIPEFVETVQQIHEAALPVVVAVQGRCLGAGCELAAAADVVVASEHAVFGQPEIVLGVFPPAACALLAGRIGPGEAAELILTGDSIDAATALRLGLVQRVVPDDQLEEAAWTLAGRIARHSRAALQATTEAMRGARGVTAAVALRRATLVYLDRLMVTEDAVEGLGAFQDKRPPQWRHR